MRIFAVNKIWADMTEACEHNTKLFIDLGKAREYILEQEKNWIELRKKNMIEDGMSEEEFEDWITESLNEDIDNNDGIYKHYIYGDGEEKIFELMGEDIEAGVFVVKEDYRYMNNQCEIGSNIHLITTDFEKAYDKAIEVRDKAQTEFAQSEYKDKEELNANEKIYSYSLEDEYDLVEVTIERYEVE